MRKFCSEIRVDGMLRKLKHLNGKKKKKKMYFNFLENDSRKNVVYPSRTGIVLVREPLRLFTGTVRRPFVA